MVLVIRGGLGDDCKEKIKHGSARGFQVARDGVDHHSPGLYLSLCNDTVPLVSYMD